MDWEETNRNYLQKITVNADNFNFASVHFIKSLSNASIVGESKKY